MLVSKRRASSAARERVLDQAERLFAEKGYDSVTLRQIAEPLGLTHASLYYHFPGGKAELFGLVMERNIRRHGDGLAASIAGGGPTLRSKLRGAADWLLSQPPMDLIRMAETDLKAVGAREARRLMDMVYTLIIKRLQTELQASADSGEIGPCSAGLIAGGLVGLIESIHSVPAKVVRRARGGMAYELIDVILKGLEYSGK
jgi:TetR/AcrR family transcriptional regulator, cholesterol catabolism regulator